MSAIKYVFEKLNNAAIFVGNIAYKIAKKIAHILHTSLKGWFALGIKICHIIVYILDKLLDALIWLFYKIVIVLSYILDKLCILANWIYKIMCKVGKKAFEIGEYVMKVMAKSLNGWLILATKIALLLLELLNWLSLGFLFIWDYVIYPIILKIRKCRERSTGQLKKKVKLFV